MTAYESRTGNVARGWAKKAAMLVLNNIIVEAVIVVILGACYIFTTAADRVLYTRLRRSFTSWLQRVSADRLNVLRKAQIRYIFKRKYGLRKIKIKLVGGSYWLSIPCMVKGIDRKTHAEKKYLAKIINDRSALKYRYLSMMRNVGLMVEGRGFKFYGYSGPRDMGEFERWCLTGIRESSVNAPVVYGLHHLVGDDYVLVMEYIEGQPLSKVDIDGELLDELFEALRSMHHHGVYHGDVKLDNFMFSKGRIYVFDCSRLESKDKKVAEAFDLACLLCALAEKVPPGAIVERARRYFSSHELRDAAGLIDVALYKSDLELSENRIKELKDALAATA